MRKNINIVHITSDYAPRALWGMGVYVQNLHTSLCDRYKDLNSCIATASKSIDEAGVVVTSKKEDDEKYLSKENDSIFDNYKNFLLWQDLLADQIIDFLRHESLGNVVIHSNNWMSWLTAKKVNKSLNIPIVSSVHFLQKQYEKMIENPIQNYHDDIIEIEKEMLNKSDWVICFSEESRKMTVNDYGLERDGVSIIHHTSKIVMCNEDVKPTHDILYLGRLTNDKGILDAIECVAEIRQVHPDTHLHVVGDGELYNEIINKNLPFITLYGYIENQEELRAVISKCSFSILLSTSDVFPISVIDSMSCGCIPVLSNLSTVSNMFEDGVSGFRIGGHLVENSARVILDLMKNDDKIVEMRKEVISFYEKEYKSEMMLEKTRAVYEAVLLNN